MLAFDRPWLLALALCAALPFVVRMLRRSGHPRLDAAPADPLSLAVDGALRLAGATAIFALVLGLAGLHLAGGLAERTGQGAHLVLLIDRSGSMDNTFANRRPDSAQESKAAAARRLLLDFLESRPHDRIGVAAFSTSPMLFLPMTNRREAVRGAVSGIDEPGLSQTDVGRGLAMAFSLFGEDSGGASRALLLVSDGAGVIARDVQRFLQAEATQKAANLYWLYLRSEGSKGIFEPPAADEIDSPQLRPERHLHLFLQRLGVPYRAFEAENPEAVAEAIEEISSLERRPLIYRERVPRRDLSGLAYGAAAACLALLALARLLERPLAARQSRPLIAEPGGKR
ncbi:vWA domain-containing protein [Algihabitans albus]|uniref:vWA domain-containing protein n=1 Tax=Algihabitans albus TaxID=2164067 RepID=UPI000E5D2F1F|nr:vWA domain-containing protein [Algihabitans albus]